MFDVIVGIVIGVVIGARPVGRGVVSQVRDGRGETGGTPGKLGMLARGGAVGAAEEGETKRRDGWPTAACDGGYISTVGEDGDVTNL